jgi:hypothetical protein
MTLIDVVTWAALFAIGFFAGMKFVEKKMMVRINKLKKRISDLTPENTEVK